MSDQDKNPLHEPLAQLIRAVEYRAACLIGGDAEKIAFANDKVWRSIDAAKIALEKP